MKVIPLELGRVAVSKQGHDKGDWFVVVGAYDERHALIADGRHRRLEKPKKKQTKHLKARPYVAQAIADALSKGSALLDSDIRKAIQAAREALAQAEPNPPPPYPNQPGGKAPCHQKEECALVKE